MAAYPLERELQIERQLAGGKPIATAVSSDGREEVQAERVKLEPRIAPWVKSVSFVMSLERVGLLLVSVKMSSWRDKGQGRGAGYNGRERCDNGEDHGVDIQLRMWKDRSCLLSSYNPPSVGRPHKRIPRSKGGSMRNHCYSNSRSTRISTNPHHKSLSSPSPNSPFVAPRHAARFGVESRRTYETRRERPSLASPGDGEKSRACSSWRRR
jgi:hypothetical protein